METRLEVMRQKNSTATLRKQWVPYERISPHLKRAIIAAEDSRFLEHEGFDFDAIQKAYEKNLRKRAGWWQAAPPSASNSQKICFCRTKKLPGARSRKRSSH